MNAHDVSTDVAPDAHGHEEHGGNAKYLAVFGALVVLTAMSFFLANSPVYETSPVVARAAMLAVSCAKALLVMLFFMHLLWEANWKYVLTIPASLMSIFLVSMLVPDIGRRTEKYNLERWRHASEPAQVQHHQTGHAADEEPHETPDEH